MKWEDLKANGERTNLLVVDGLNLAFRYKHNGSTNFAADYLRLIQSLAQSYQACKVIVTSDWGKSSYRLGIDEEYKGNRKKLRETQTDDEKQAFKAFMEEFNRTMTLVGEVYPVVKFKGVEADDIASYIAKKFPNSDLEHCWLVSSDKDWDLLITNKVSRFSYVTRKETTMENFEEIHSCSPEEFISMKCLMGDSGDNVKGIAGVGAKRAYCLIKEHGSAFDIWDQIPLPGNYVYIKNVNQSEDLILTNYKLMDLLSYCEEAIGDDNLKELDNTLGRYIGAN
jgi:5'-3' exonuclease